MKTECRLEWWSETFVSVRPKPVELMSREGDVYRQNGYFIILYVLYLLLLKYAFMYHKCIYYVNFIIVREMLHRLEQSNTPHHVFNKHLSIRLKKRIRGSFPCAVVDIWHT